jgi:hypothetical protein
VLRLALRGLGIDCALVGDAPALRIDDEHFTRIGCTESLAHQLQFIIQDWDLSAERLGIGFDVGARVTRARVQHHQLDSRELHGERGEGRRHRTRAVVARQVHTDHDGLRIPQAVQLTGEAAVIDQLKVVDDLGLGCGCIRRRPMHSQQQGRGDGRDTRTAKCLHDDVSVRFDSNAGAISMFGADVVKAQQSTPTPCLAECPRADQQMHIEKALRALNIGRVRNCTQFMHHADGDIVGIMSADSDSWRVAANSGLG